MWVAACLYKGGVDVYRLFVGELDDDDRRPALRRRHDTGHHAAGASRRCGPPTAPPSTSTGSARWTRCTSTTPCASTCTRSPRAASRGVKLPARLQRKSDAVRTCCITTGFLPQRFRDEMRLPWDDDMQRRFDRVIKVLSTVNHCLPRFVRQFPFNVLLKDLDSADADRAPAGLRPVRLRRVDRRRPCGLHESERDTWDITTSVGSTALFVAAARALEAQKPEPLAARPLRRGLLPRGGRRVGRRARRRRPATTGRRTAASPTSASTSSSSRARAPSTSTTTSPAARRGRPADRPARGGAGLARVSAALAGRHRRLRARPAAGSRVQARGARRARLCTDAPSAARSPSTCATTGPGAAGRPVSTRRGRRRGSPRACSSTCPPPRRSNCSRASTRCPAPAAAWRSKRASRCPRRCSRPSSRRSGDAGRGAAVLQAHLQRAASHPAAEWFGARGWSAEDDAAARLPAGDVGRPVPVDRPEAGPMAGSISLVSAIKG